MLLETGSRSVKIDSGTTGVRLDISCLFFTVESYVSSYLAIFLSLSLPPESILKRIEIIHESFMDYTRVVSLRQGFDPQIDSGGERKS